MIPAALIYNPASGRGSEKGAALASVLDELRRHGVEARPRPTEATGHATELAREAVGTGARLVLGWGGDGTLNQVATGLLGSGVPLGVLPGGTVNVFAREAGIPLALDAACELVARGEPVSIPVGLAGGRPFLLMAGVGLDGAVVHLLKTKLKRQLGVTAFWLEGFRQLARYRFAPFRVRGADRTVVGTGLVAGKTRLYGNGWVVTPRAALRTPFLDVVIFQGRSPLAYLRYLTGIALGAHVRFKDVVHLQAESIDIESGEEVLCQVDGEPAGAAPGRIEMRQEGLRVVLPAGVKAPA